MSPTTETKTVQLAIPLISKKLSHLNIQHDTLRYVGSKHNIFISDEQNVFIKFSKTDNPKALRNEAHFLWGNLKKY